MAEVVELHKLKLAELKQECALRGLEVKGNKGDLIARLQAYLDEHEEEVNEEEVLEEDTEEAFPKEEAAVPEPILPEPEVTAPKKLVKISLSASADERLQKRAERFNLPPNTDTKKAARAARFGLPVTTSTATQGTTSKASVDVEVLKKRAARFGMNVSSVSKKHMVLVGNIATKPGIKGMFFSKENLMLQVEEDEKLKKRKERFGIVTSAASIGADDAEVKKRKRAERFGIV